MLARREGDGRCRAQAAARLLGRPSRTCRACAIDGLRASADAIKKLLGRRRAGETITVHAFRRDELVVAELALEAAPEDTCWLTLAAVVDDDTRARRDAWLGIAPPSDVVPAQAGN